LSFSLLRFTSQNFFPKEKTEKKKATKRYGQSEKPKGNGIIGGVPFRGGNRLCHSLLAGLVPIKPLLPFYPFCLGKNSFLTIKNEYVF